MKQQQRIDREAQAAEALRIQNLRRYRIQQALDKLVEQIIAAPELETNFPALTELKKQLKAEC